MLQVPIVARRPAHPGGYACLPVEVYRISWVLANIEQCCDDPNEPSDGVAATHADPSALRLKSAPRRDGKPLPLAGGPGRARGSGMRPSTSWTRINVMIVRSAESGVSNPVTRLGGTI